MDLSEYGDNDESELPSFHFTFGASNTLRASKGGSACSAIPPWLILTLILTQTLHWLCETVQVRWKLGEGRHGRRVEMKRAFPLLS